MDKKAKTPRRRSRGIMDFRRKIGCGIVTEKKGRMGTGNVFLKAKK
jgi:hypothetical protein